MKLVVNSGYYITSNFVIYTGGSLATMRNPRNVNRILVGKCFGKQPFQRVRRS